MGLVSIETNNKDKISNKIYKKKLDIKMKKEPNRNVKLMATAKPSSNSSTTNLVDEIIHVDITLSSIATVASIHRQFAMLCAVDNTIYLTLANWQDEVGKLTDDIIKSYVTIWFNSGGQNLTLYNSNGDIANYSIAEGSIILAGLASADQETAYKALGEEITGYKNIFISAKPGDDLSYITPARNKFCFLVNDNGGADSENSAADNVVFEYLAPYSQDKYYRKNNFESSNLAGLNLVSLSSLKSANLGALVYFPEFQESKYYNIVDFSGYPMNWDFLKDDLKVDIQAKMLTLLATDDAYDQANIARLESSMVKVSQFYIDNNLIYGVKTSSLPLVKQSTEDFKKGIIRGFTLNYVPKAEIKEVYVGLVEKTSI